jgi:hypothetical protein
VISSPLFFALLLAPPDYVGWQGLEIHPRDAAERDVALRLVDELPVHRRTDAEATAPLPALASPQTRAALEVAGIEYTLRIPDVRDAIDAERERIDSAPVPRDFDQWFEEFRDLDEIESQVDAYAQQFPSLVTLADVGTSIEMRAIRSMRIARGADVRPALAYVATQHSREWISPMVGMCIADHFVRGYGVDDEITALLDAIEIHLIPMANPDGYVQTWGPDRLWRKNTRDGTGVDLNRNWAEGWGVEPGSSPDPTEETYRGSAAFSEPETVAISDWIVAIPDLKTIADLHSFGALVVSSWAYTDDPPADLDRLRAWGDALERQMDAIGPHDFTSLHSAEANAALGNASGTLPDWVHATTGVPAFTIELPPPFDGPSNWGFEIPPDAIIPICEQAIAGVMEHARWVASDGALSVEIATPLDGAVFADGPVTIPITMDVVTPGPVEIGLRIDDADVGWTDDVRPFSADDVLFPVGTFSLVATARTWDGATAESAPVTITVDATASESDASTDSTDSAGSSATGETAGGESSEDGGGEVGTGTEGGGAALEPSGCACGVDGSRDPLEAWWLMVPALGWRRRQGT